MTISPSEIPKPVFKTCDETSLRLTWDSSSLQHTLESAGATFTVRVQYKEVHEGWEKAREIDIPTSQGPELKVELLLKEADIVDLKPGTPYYVRFALYHKEDPNVVVLGPDTVFDTKPVDCTPKRKTCTVS